jgi:hypothetical protein
MLKTTARQLRDKAIAGDLGQPVVCSAAINQSVSGSAVPMFRVPRGQVLLITSVQTQTGNNKHGLSTTPTNSPGPSFYAIQISNESGTPQWTFGFMSFIRNATVFNASTPNAESAEPGNVEVWHPKYAIPVPGGFSVELNSTQGDFGNHGCIHGFLVDEAAAKSMGYNLNPDATKSRHGIAVSRGSASAVEAEADELIPGRPGKHIRILDMHVRVQPSTNTLNQVLLLQGTGLERFYGIVNANVVDGVEQKFSPDELFLGEGEGVAISTEIDDQCSVVIHYEYVDHEDVPANAFWSYLTPTRPTPNATAVSVNARRSQQVFTLYYPKGGGTKTVPGVGHQHLVRGISVSVQKAGGAFENSVQNVEQTLFTVAHGASASNLGFSLLSLTQGNVQLMPTLHAGLHNQNVSFVDDAMNAACKRDDGAIWFQSLGLANDGTALGGTGAVASSSADIVAWHSTIWGRTIAATYRDTLNRGD